MKSILESGVESFDGLRGAWSVAGRNARQEALESAGRELHAELLRGPRVAGYESFDLVTLPYPTGYGLYHGCALPFPYLWLRHRMIVVRFMQRGISKVLVFNPTDHLQARRTPYFWALSQRYGDFISHRLLSRVHGDFMERLREAGVAPEEVDYVAFDHLHTQDIRRHAGTKEMEAALPRALFLIPRAEFAIWNDEHPLQHAWYVPGAIQGLDTSRVVLFDGDLRLGDGVMLITTPGHTMGNQSLVVATEDGVYVTSENGISADSYAPRESSIPGIRRFARDRGLSVILNANTVEASFDQHDSMVLERAIAGPARRDGRFPNFYPSSELTPHLLAPGICPAFRHGTVRIGRLRA